MPQSVLRDREAVARAVSQNTSMAGALRQLGLKPAGGNYRALHQACDRFGLAVPVWQPASKSRLPDSNGSPANSGLPDELRQQGGTSLWPAMRIAVLIAAGLAAGAYLALGAEHNGWAALAGAVVVCLLVLAIAMS